MSEKNELEIYLCAALAMARRGLIVSAAGMVQLDDGSIKIADIGYRPSVSAIASNIALYVPQSNNLALAKVFINLIRLAREGRLIGFGGVVVFRDGIVDRLGVGSLRGLLAVMQTLTFQPPSFSADRRKQPDRRHQQRQSYDQRRHVNRD